MKIKFECGGCGKIIHEVETSFYCGGPIPHAECGNVTTFAPTQAGRKPEIIDVRPMHFENLKTADYHSENLGIENNNDAKKDGDGPAQAQTSKDEREFAADEPGTKAGRKKGK